MKLTQEQLNEMAQLEKDGYLTIQRHPEFPLNIANYTHMCQFEKKWNEITMMCRGLIYKDDGEVIARPFKKFFNIGESFEPGKDAPALPDEPFEVYEKMDGSLGIIFLYDGKLRIATRGSFMSEQSIRGQEILDKHMASTSNLLVDDSKTYLVEVVYPENRIVVDYGKVERLYALAVIDNETGMDVDRDIYFRGLKWGFTEFTGFAKRFEGIQNINELVEKGEVV